MLKFNGQYTDNHFLLIVPYGIETPEQNYSPHPDNTFNRTLWN